MNYTTFLCKEVGSMLRMTIDHVASFFEDERILLWLWFLED